MFPKAKYTPTIISSFFLNSFDNEFGDNLTHLKLQKLLYYSQAWSLTIFNEPLFEEDFQAWTHGPVLPSVFHEYKKYSYNPLPASNIDTDISKPTTDLLNDILNIYGEKSAKYLENLTHSETPWIEARNGISLEASCSNIIDKNVMQEFYKKIGYPRKVGHFIAHASQVFFT